MDFSFSQIRLQNVRKVYGRYPVLHGVSFDLQGGRCALLMGPNGAGKSTLLAIVSTLSRPTSGEVSFGQHDHRHAESTFRNRIGLLAHSSMLYPQMSARENLLFFAGIHGVKRPKDTVSRWLDRMELENRNADKPVSFLSRGMQQRVSLARALLHEPDLILMDEPFTGLDRDASKILHSELRTQAQCGRIVLIVSHDLEGVDCLCKHLLILDRGRLVLDHQGDLLPAQQIQERYHGAI